MTRVIPVYFVISAYNEERVLARTLTTLATALARGAAGTIPWTILIADNNSSDATASLARQFVADHPEYARYFPVAAQGRGHVLREVARAHPDAALCFLDADLPLELDDVRLLLLPLFEGRADIVVGKRKGTRPLLRRLMTASWRIATRAFFGLPLSDPQCGALAILPRAAAVLAETTRERGWLINTEFLLAARAQGLGLIETPIRWLDQRYPERESTVPIARYASQASLFLITHAQSTALPLCIITLTGMVFALLGIFQLAFIAQHDFTVAHHLRPLLPLLQDHVRLSALAFATLAFPLYAAFRKLPWRTGMGALILGTVILWGIGFATVPTRSHDAYWNLAFGKIAAVYGENPYRTPPGVLTNDTWTAPIGGFQDLTLSHGPLWALAVAGIASVAAGSLGTALALLKTLSVALLLAAGYFFWEAGARRNTPHHDRIARLALVAWSPFLIQTCLVDTHNDIFILLGVLASYTFLLRGRHAASALALVAAGFVKYVSLLLIPIPLISLVHNVGLRAALRKTTLIAAIAIGAAVALYLPFGAPWHNASGLLRQVFDIVNPYFGTILSVAGAIVVGPYALWYLGIAAALATLVWFLMEGKLLHAYAAPLLALVAVGTLWLQSWYLLWTLPLLALAASPVALIAYLSLAFIVPEGLSPLTASLVAALGIGWWVIKRRNRCSAEAFLTA